VRSLSATEARRVAIMGQLLGGSRPRGIVEVVERLGRVQMDPTVIVERAERLTLWSRLGPYDRDELRSLLEAEPRRLFEYNAYLLPVEDLALHRPVMAAYPPTRYTRGRYIAEWLRDNHAFRDYVLGELRTRGPLRARDLDDRAEVPWSTGGWNDGKNLSRMLEILWLRGEIAVARRQGGERVWDLFDRVLPAEATADLPDDVLATLAMERQLRAAGVAADGFGGAIDLGRLAAREAALEGLLADGIAVSVRISGAPGTWYAHRDGLAELDAGAWTPRTTLLGPFDPLIHDRQRAEELFGFRFTFELYVPAARRRYGPYTLAVLHGDRLTGRIDAVVDRRRRTLEVRGAWDEPRVPAGARRGAERAIDELAAWLGVARAGAG
jgi:uncharacterized protein YcaQ